MLGLDMLDVAIGLALVYFVFSLAVTAAKEALEAGLKYRARDLEKGVRELLDDPDGSRFATAFYQHPMIYSLYRGGSAGTKRILPSYIPARNFALAMLDLVKGPVPVAAHQAPSERVTRAVEIAIQAGGGDPDRTRAELEAWFDSAMDRVSGWYKRRTQVIVLLLGLVMSVAANVDTIAIFRTLQVDQDLRKVLVKKAEDRIALEAAAGRAAPAPAVTAPAASPSAPGAPPMAGASSADPARALEGAAAVSPAPRNRPDGPKDPIDELRETSLPIGWSADQQEKFAAKLKNPLALAEVAVGWLLTAFAVMLGSPFWFDVLNRLMVIRSTVKPHEKSPEEASEDKQGATRTGRASPPSSVVINVPPTGSWAASTDAGAAGPAALVGSGTSAAFAAAPAADDEPDQHEDGCLCDHPIAQADETVDHDLPPATGGVAAPR